MLFNRAINNTDDHERNFSLIYRNTGYQLAPAYDLVPDLTLGQYPAAGFHYQPHSPSLSEVAKHGKIFGLSKPRVASCAESVTKSVCNWAIYAEQAGVSAQDADLVEKTFNL